jgi:RNA polymerase sigma-70 factor (ECF subfamily)
MRANLNEMNDGELVKLCRQRVQGAWDELVRRHRRRVFNIAYQFAGRYDVAEDLSQELFLRIFHALDRFETDRNFISWLMRIARNLCIDHYRRRQRERELLLDTGQDIQTIPSKRRDAYSLVRSHEKASFLKRGLAALSPDLRSAVVLRDLQGLSYQEIAAKLEIPEGTVKSRINRGRLELARVLKQRDKCEQVMGKTDRPRRKATRSKGARTKP